MWLITPFGFFSIVRKPSDIRKDTLTVRARIASDLDELRNLHLPELGPTAKSAGTDYRYRAVAPRAAVARAMRQTVEVLDYSNFKDAVAERQGQARSAVYHDVWSVLMRLQKDEARFTRKVLSAAALKIVEADTYGGALINNSGTRILLREPLNHFGGYVWTFPKGGPDKGETPAQAALREVKEETGYAAEIIGALPIAFKGSTTKTTAFFVMRPLGDASGRTPETAQTKWATMTEARTLISLTKTKSGRGRDLAVVDSIEAWIGMNPASRRPD